MADPLSLVRDFNVDKKLDKIRTTGDNVDFDGMYMFPKSSFTAFRGAKDYCTLEVVLYVLNTRALQQPDYLKQAAAAKLETLSFIERKKLLDILDGKTNLQLEAVPGAKAAEDSRDDNEPAAKRAKLADDMPAVQVQERFHRQLRDRNTMLLAPQKDFKLVFDIASRAHMQLSTMFKQRQQEEHQQAKAADAKQQRHDKHAQAQPSKASAPGGTKPSGRFDRDTTTDALKAFGGEAAAGINSVIAMYGSHADTGGQEGPTNGAAAHAPAPAPASQSSRGKDAHHQQQQQRHSSHKHASSSQPQPSKPVPGSRHVPAAPPAAPADPLAGAVPIIIVPSGMTAMINMFNAAEFLESGQFKPSVEAAALAKGVKAPSVTIRRTMGKPPGKSVPYLVTDKPNDKKDHLWWGRVVAVIAQGAKWQFKDFPFKGADKGDMVETFQKVAGFYVHWANEAVPDMVANWNVKPLGLARDKRHMDTPVVLELYRHIDAFLSNRKSPLAY